MTTIPVFQSTMNPLLEVLRETPAPLSIEAMERRVAERMRLPAALLAIPHDAEKPDRSEVGYRIAWARTWLKKAGLLDNPNRGEWTVTEKGRAAGHIDVNALLADVARGYRAKAAGQQPTSNATPQGDDDPADETFDAEAEIDASKDEASAARVGPVLAAELRDLYEKLSSDGVLPARGETAAMLATFHQRFAPAILGGLDGLPLLTRLHARGTKESLVHWLEFKDDEELANSRFGSIAGGSALKFGLYQSVETGAWMTGTPLHQVRLELDDAIAMARLQRDELVAAARVLESAAKTGDVDYDALQEQLVRVAPTVADTAWGHKTLAMWFPDHLDPFHVQDHQAHHLRKLLKLTAPGRYANAGLFVGIARQLGMSLLELATGARSAKRRSVRNLANRNEG